MPDKQRIIIIGGGFGGAYCAQALEKKLGKLADQTEILLINRTNYFVFYPLLMEAGTGSLQPRHAVVSIRSFLKSATFKMAQLVQLDHKNSRITYQLIGDTPHHEITYDQLVIAVGSVTRLPAVPGLREFGYEMKSLADAVALRDRAIHMLELAEAADDPALMHERLHFVVVGGNFSGAEVAGELHTFLYHASKLYPHISHSDYKVTLIDMADRILNAIDPDLSEYAFQNMTKRGIDIRLKESVKQITSGDITLNSGANLKARTLIWCAGVEPHPLTPDLQLPTDECGYILTERDLRVTGFDHIWAIGDCAVNPDPQGNAYPATAQHAVQEGIHLADNLVRALNNRPAEPCDITTKGSIAALGCRTGVAKVFGIKLSGFPAWWLWRTVYLMKMPGWPRRIQIALEWTLDLLFKRDIVQLGVHRPKHD